MLNFAFVGCGNVARFHADVILGMNHRISSVCARKQSPRIGAFAKDYMISRTYDTWKEMLTKDKPDAVVIAASWDQIENIAEDIINTGIPCLVEKPFALSSKKIEEVLSGTQRFSKNVLVGYNRRFYDFIPTLKKTIESHELISIDLNLPEAAEHIIKLYSKSIIEHILIYMSSHWLDLLMYLIGDVRVDYMHHGKIKDDYCISYNGILYSLKYNIPIHLQINFNAPSQISMSFNFSDSIYRLCPIEMLTVYKGMERIEPDNKIRFRRYMPKVIETYEVNAEYKPGFYKQMENFIKTCIEHSQANEVGCTLNDALRVTELCEKIKSGDSILEMHWRDN